MNPLQPAAVCSFFTPIILITSNAPKSHILGSVFAAVLQVGQMSMRARAKKGVALTKSDPQTHTQPFHAFNVARDPSAPVQI